MRRHYRQARRQALEEERKSEAVGRLRYKGGLWQERRSLRAGATQSPTTGEGVGWVGQMGNVYIRRAPLPKYPRLKYLFQRGSAVTAKVMECGCVQVVRIPNALYRNHIGIVDSNYNAANKTNVVCR